MKLLHEILNDQTSGASALYKKTLYLLQSESKYRSPDKALKVIYKIKTQFPEMAVFEYLFQSLNRVNKEDLTSRLRLLMLECSTELEFINDNLKRLWRKKRRVITFSNSSIVEHILCKSQNKVESVLLSQASPRNEGIILGKKLNKAGLKVEICTDAALANLIRKSDYVFLGADCVTRKYFVNKTGTYPLLLAAKAKGAKSFILCEKFKFVPSYKFAPRPQKTSEIAKALSEKLKVQNYYFEKIPLFLVDYLVSRSGMKKITGRQ
ncbi:MAG: hypothetical protein V3V99_09700 [candidate division Zixibacteria bacterium]